MAQTHDCSLYSCWLTVDFVVLGGAVLWASYHHSDSSIAHSDNRAREDLYATSLLHRFTTSRQRETCARQLSHAG
eukprot:5744982-Prymnesium_polylepis.1